MIKKGSFFLSLVSVSLLISGCAKPPTMEMADAENAIHAAELAGAAEYASTDLKEAQDALVEAQNKMAEKDYKAALAGALDARLKAETAESAVASGKEAAKAAAMEIITQVEQKIKSLKIKLAKASPKQKSSLQDIEMEWTNVMEDFMNGNYSEVSNSASKLLPQLEQLEKTEIPVEKKKLPPQKAKKK
jgi:hypothetical protein